MHDDAFRIRRAESGDEPLLRKIRLEALAEAPDAFGSTLDRERARTLVDWRKWLSPSATFMLETATGLKGIAAGVPDSMDPAVVHLMAMWVHPALRGSGAAAGLVQAVLAWAEEQGIMGSVRLYFTVDAAGNVRSNIRVTKTTGYPALDQLGGFDRAGRGQRCRRG